MVHPLPFFEPSILDQTGSVLNSSSESLGETIGSPFLTSSPITQAQQSKSKPSQLRVMVVNFQGLYPKRRTVEYS